MSGMEKISDAIQIIAQMVNGMTGLWFDLNVVI